MKQNESYPLQLCNVEITGDACFSEQNLCEPELTP